MRNVAFLAIGIALLVLQENVFRAVDDLRPALALAIWLVAITVDVLQAVRPIRATPEHNRVFSMLRFDWSLPATVLLGYAVLVNVAGWHVGRPIPTLVLPLILFMGVHEYSLARGAAVAFAFGYITDVLGIAPIGLYTFTYVATFVLARAAGLRLAAQTIWMQVLLVAAFTLVESTMVLVLLAIFGRDPWVPRSLYPLALPHTIATAAVAPVIFRISQAVHAATTNSPRTEAARGAQS